MRISALSAILSFKKQKLFLVITTALILLSLPVITALGSGANAPLEAPSAGVSLSGLGGVFIGDDFTFTATFSNGGDAVGYGPFIDVVYPETGIDGADGIIYTANNVSYLGLAVNDYISIPFPDDGGGTGCVDHPLAVDSSSAPLQVCGPTGDRLVTYELPFGSFTPGQTPIDIDITVNLHEHADLGTDLNLFVRGGYRFGADPLDNPASDTPIVSNSSTNSTAWPSGSVTPTIMLISKQYIGTEDETATGPNFPRTYEITIDIAENQTITNLDISDVLSPLVQYTALISLDNQGAPATITDISTPSTTTPGGTLTRRLSSVTGTAATNDVTMTFSFYAPRLNGSSNRILNIITGDDVPANDSASGSGTWDPIDTSDPTITVNAGATDNGHLHTLSEQSIAIQKSGPTIVEGGGARPGKTLEYTLDFQVSDFFAFQNLMIHDLISDGQHFDQSFTPTLTFTEHGTALNVSLQAANFTEQQNWPGGDGTTEMFFRVSDEFIYNNFGVITNGSSNSIGAALGGCVDPAGASSPDDGDCNDFNSGATSGTIVYRTIILDAFVDAYPSDPSVDHGDVLNNSVTISGDILENYDFSDPVDPTGSSESDGSSASVVIEKGVTTKTIYAVDGNTSYSSPVKVDPGSTVTYRLTYTLPSSDFEDLYFIDYLPLPVFDVDDETWSFDPTIDASVPPSGTVKFGDTETFYTSRPGFSNYSPTVTPNSASNYIRIDYGTYDDPNDPSTKIDLLFTVTVSDDPFADGLYLTNQALVFESSTNGEDTEDKAAVQIELMEPVVDIQKGAVATDGDGTFPGNDPVNITAPGTAGFRYTGGTINSTNYASLNFDANLEDADAGDLVTFMILLENTGQSNAYDVIISDAMESEYSTPGSGLNLNVSDGTGTALAYTGSLFAGGIEITDDAAGRLRANHATSGENIIVVTYDLALNSTVLPDITITNTATLDNYAGDEGSPNHVPSGKTDDATVDTPDADVTKTITGTNVADTTGTNVAIGEYVYFQAVIDLIEGDYGTATYTDTMEEGLALVSIDSITPDAGVTYNSANVTINDYNSPYGDASEFEIDFVNLQNTNNASGYESITINYTVVVTNDYRSDRGDVLSNDGQLSWTSGTSLAGSAAVTVVEPALEVTHSVNPSTGDAGDTVTFTILIDHAASSNAVAYDPTFTSLYDSKITINSGSLDCTGGTITPDSSSFTGQSLNIVWTPPISFGLSDTTECTFTGTLNNDVLPEEVLENDAEVWWTSLFDDVTTAQTANNNLSVERTGDISDPGGATNDYRDTDPADVTIDSPAPSKRDIDSSESHTPTAARATIGEIIRYSLYTRIPEGDSPDTKLVDLIPAGMQFIDDGTAMFALVSNVIDVTSSTLDPAALNCDGGGNPNMVLSGNESTIDSLSPECPVPALMVSSDLANTADTYNNGSDVYFHFGDLINLDDDSDSEYILLEFNALVLNVSSNQAGTQLDNQLRVYIDGGYKGATVTDTIYVEEATLSISKSLTSAPADAGDSLEYTVTITNVAGTYGSTAFDFTFTDTLDPTVFTNVGFSTSIPGYTAESGDLNPDADKIELDFSELREGDSVTITITADLLTTLSAQLEIANEGDVVWTSLPGTNGTAGNSTGTDTPGTSGSGTGQRDGTTPSLALNDYAATDDDSYVLNAPSLDKKLPSPTSYSIGEVIDYYITITTPEGVSEDLTFADDLEAGLEVVNGSAEIITTAALSSGYLTRDYPGTFELAATINYTTGSGGGFTIDFGDVTNTPNAFIDDETFLIHFQAVVLNIAANDQGDVLTNTATITWTDPTNFDTETASDSEDVILKEPFLQVSKSADNTTPGYGDTVEYTIDLSHTAGSDASTYHVDITDEIPAGMTYVASNANQPAGWTLDTSSLPTIRWYQSDNSAFADGDTESFTYQTTIDTPPAANAVDVSVPAERDLTNSVQVVWESIPVSNGDERTGDDNGGTEPYNDYLTTTDDTVTVTHPDLRIDKSNSETTVAAGDTITFTLDYFSDGNKDTTSTVITDTVPDYTTFDSAGSSVGWSCADNAPAGTICTYTIGTFAAGGSGSIDFAVTIDSVLPPGVTTIENTARVDYDEETDGTDYTPDNNQDTDTVSDTEALPDLSIVKDDGVIVVAPEEVLVYTITYQNIGNQDSTGVVITETVPDGATFNAANSDTGWMIENTSVPCTTGLPETTVCEYLAGDLDVVDGAQTVLFAVTIVDAAAFSAYDPPLNYIENIVTIEDDGNNGTDPDTSNNSDDDYDALATEFSKTLVDINQPALSAPPTIAADSPVAIGSILTYDLVLTVPGSGGPLPNPIVMESVRVDDTLDIGLAFVECVNVTPSSGFLSTSLAGGFDDACNPNSNDPVNGNPSITPVTGNDEELAHEISFALGSVTNNNTSDETITITYQVVVLNSTANVDGVSLSNQAAWIWNGGELDDDGQRVLIQEPDLGIQKTVNLDTAIVGQTATFTITIFHTDDSNADAFDVVLLDEIPNGLNLDEGSVVHTGGPAPDRLEVLNFPYRIEAEWEEFPAGAVSEIQFTASIRFFSNGRITNEASVQWTSLPDEDVVPLSDFNPLSTQRVYDPDDPANFYGGIIDQASIEEILPDTGFTPGQITELPLQPEDFVYTVLGGVRLVIPSLDVDIAILGVPFDGETGWDVTWLGGSAGHLEGTALPTQTGNTFITAHVFDSFGRPGPFADLNQLGWGDLIYLESEGKTYTYQVVNKLIVDPNDSSILWHDNYDRLTLLTCYMYDEQTDSYRYRLIIQAILISVE